MAMAMRSGRRAATRMTWLCMPWTQAPLELLLRPDEGVLLLLATSGGCNAIPAPLVCKSAGFTRHENTHARDGIKRPEGWEVEDGKRAWAEGQAASAARGGQAAPLNAGFGLLLVSSKTRKGEEAGRAREGGEGMRGREERAAAAAETIGGRWSMSRPSLMRARKQLWRCCLS